MTRGVWFGGRARLLHARTHVDDRGWLTTLDADLAGFGVTRAFLVGSADGSTRGGHAHRQGRQLLTLVTGRVRVDMRWRGEAASQELAGDDRSILIEPGVWATQTYLDPLSSLVVLCDTPYDLADYVHDPEEEASSW
jgi:dTDP-4-dehydrorhamnose 3,5-epimerase-like enzyme